jgi:ATP-dependent helicase/nuclease subunit A
MLVSEEKILVVDFKTNRPAPDRIDNADPAYLTQMALYVAALRVVFPDRPVEGALVWTDGPKLMPVPEEVVRSRLTALRRAC